MELADVVSTTLNKAQAASNHLVRSNTDRALLEMESLCDFLQKEMPKREDEVSESEKSVEVTAEKTDKGIEAETPGAEASAETRPGSHGTQTQEKPKQTTEEPTDEALR